MRGIQGHVCILLHCPKMVQVLQVDFRFSFSFDILYQVDLQKGLEGEQREARGS